MGSRKPAAVCIIDDDEAIRESLRLLLYANGLSSVVYASADAFLADPDPPAFDCMLLDIRMPGTDGLELFRILNALLGAAAPAAPSGRLVRAYVADVYFGRRGTLEGEIAATGAPQPRLLARREAEIGRGPSEWPFAN